MKITGISYFRKKTSKQKTTSFERISAKSTSKGSFVSDPFFYNIHLYIHIFWLKSYQKPESLILILGLKVCAATDAGGS